MDRLAGMESFVAVAETGSFSAAAKRLGLSRAVVGKRVAALEKAMGAKLLNRTTRQVRITGPGAEFYERCRIIIVEFATAGHELARNQAEPEGVVKLNAPMSFGQLHVAPAVLDFMERYPKIIIHLTLTDRFVDVVAEGYDLVVRIGDLDDSSLMSRQLAPVRRVLCASPDYVRTLGMPQSPADLEGHRVLHYGWRRTGTRWDLVNSGGRTFVDVSVGYCANNGEVLAAAAVAGRGITLLPLFIVGADLQHGRLVRVLPDYEATTVGLHVLWPPNNLQPTRVRNLIDFLVERFASRPQWDLVT